MTSSRHRALPRAAAALAALAFLLGTLLPAAPGAIASASQTWAAASASAGGSADSAASAASGTDPDGWIRADRADEPRATPAPGPGRTPYPIVPAALVAAVLVVVLVVAHVVLRRRRTVGVRGRVAPRAPRAPPVRSSGLPA